MPLSRAPAGGGDGRGHRVGPEEATTTERRDSPTTTEVEIVGAFLAQGRASARVMDAWKRVISRVGDGGETEAIRSLREDVAQIKTMLRTQTTKPTYAQAAASQAKSDTVPIPPRTYREIVVAPGTETDEQKQRNGRELVEELQRVGAGAEVRRKRYTVIVHGIRRTQLDTSDQKKAFTEIYAQNAGWKDRVEILGVSWARRTPREGTVTTPLLLSVAEPSQGDTLIDEGFLWNYQLHDCEPFYGDCKITQCFKCYQYGHVARMCNSSPMCGFCSGKDHATNDCVTKPDPTRHRCGVCPGHGAHPAWSRNCPVRQNKQALAREAYASRPVRFLKQAEKQATMADFPFPVFSQAMPTQEDEVELLSSQRGRKRLATGTGGWTTIRARGRPPILEEGNMRIDSMMRGTFNTPPAGTPETPSSTSNEGN